MHVCRVKEDGVAVDSVDSVSGVDNVGGMSG
jgi:hypothetical protein